MRFQSPRPRKAVKMVQILRPLHRNSSFPEGRAVAIANHRGAKALTTRDRIDPMSLAHPGPRDGRGHRNRTNSTSTTVPMAANQASSTRKAAHRASHIQPPTQVFTLAFQSKACRRFRQPCIHIPLAKVGLPRYRSML